ncbi:MAG: aminopeptidase [Clostridia bacterium]|nr:aminopeptidase [Clostridia bacterium]
MKKSVLTAYARLAIKKGLNLQKGQGLQIFVPAEQYEFARICAHEAYRAGAAWVMMEWSDQRITKDGYKYQTLKQLSTMEDWRKEKYNYLAKELPCRLHILADDPDGLKGVDQAKVTKAQKALFPYIEPYRNAIDNRHQWCIIGVPSAAWAKKMFPHLKKQAAINALWDAILACARVDADPEAAWDKHNATLQQKCDKINALKLESLHITSERGTDVTIGLMEKGSFLGGGEYTEQGVYYNPNMPTEEVFTTPKAGVADGVVVSSKPLSYQGRMIEDFTLEFKDGRVVRHTARVGEDILGELLGSDEGAARLGEVAIVPTSSPVNKTGLLFYNTLYDENAACHLAIGRGFENTVVNYGDYSRDELTEMGVNRSMIHIDFMIGTDKTRIVGKNADGEVVIFDGGEWVI